MLRKLRRKIKSRDCENARKLVAAFCAAALLAGTSAPAWADTGPQSFADGLPHTVTDNIVAPGVTGLSAANAGTSAAMNGLTITLTGSPIGQNGAEAIFGGTINLTDVAIGISGISGISNNFGLFSGEAGSRIVMTGGVITTIGGMGAEASRDSAIRLTNVAVVADSTGVAACLGGTIAMTGGSVTETGGFSAVWAINPGSTVTLTDVTVRTAAANAYGLLTNLGGTIAMTGGSITTAGADSDGVAVYGGPVTLSNVAITATGTGSYALFSAGGGVNATVNGQSIYGAGGLIYAQSGVVNLAANSGSRLYGITTLAGGMANLTLNGNAAWMMPGNSALTTLTLHNGNAIFTSPSSGGYKTLTLGTLTGSGGTFRLSANPGANLADLVSVGGTAGGSHQVAATILGGVPANLYQTVKLVDLVNEGAAHTAGFSGGGDVGAWRYGVAQGSALTGYSGVGSLADYYLYNTFGPSTPARAAIGDSAAGTVLWHGEMNEVKKRLGDFRMGAKADGDFWVRTYADKFNVRQGGAYAFSQIVRGIEVGKDNSQAFAGGKKFTGFVAGAGEADNTFSSGGKGDIHSVYAGAYGSWLKDDGAYFDLVGKYNLFRHSFSSPILGGGSDSGSYRNKGLGLSAEIGKRLERGNGVFIQPEAELSALWLGRAGYTSAGGLAVEVPSADSLQLRLGCTVGRKWQADDGASRQVYGKLSWVNEFRGMSRTVVDSVPFDASLKGHQWVTGVGFVEDTGSRQLYIDVEKSWGTAVSKAWGVNAGYRWKF